MYPLVTIPDAMLPFREYTHIDLCVSGGNDSTAMVLSLLHEYKAPKETMRLIHFRIDGPNENPVFFDWEETDSHLQYLSDFFDIPLVTIWDEKGLKTRIEERGMFPDSMNRFCTSYGKRDCYTKYVRRRRGNGTKTLCCSGELASESNKRSTYPAFQVHPASATKKMNRLVHTFRPVLHFQKQSVRAIMQEHGVKEHACYQYVSRCSCRFCIFLKKSELRTVAQLFPDQFSELKSMEKRMGHTMRFINGQRVPLSEFVGENRSVQTIDLFTMNCCG
ncbi:PAPS reductase/FAD synthetase [Paenibacillus sp. GYB003]|uniref:PAPS reductase/FAD synthetase n=1 Tax=Paenibacillus sp. GYB003 TaxID=2994392 RepID=UPI002F96CED7